jgi:tyrosyl-tRNA synthetase
MSKFILELQWRSMLHDLTPGIEDFISKKSKSAYIGFDPTSDSLHIGNLVPIMLLAHFQRHGHKPIALIGGATGMIGDPSGKSSERNLLDEQTLIFNQEKIKKQLSKFLIFDSKKDNDAEVLNNHDWMKSISFLQFIRDYGKHISVNYMMAKDSVKNRISSENASGMSYTEFSYQMVQGYDFLHLKRNYDCHIQMGGSDQWGNITTGMELIRRVDNDKGYALTCPLITRADGKKFGKSEKGNIWLDKTKTSVFRFYQYWLNTTDEDAEKFIKIFTFLGKSEIDELIHEHKKAPHLRILQKKLAAEITTIVHSEEEMNKSSEASNVLFSKNFLNEISKIDEKTFLEIFEGVPSAEIKYNELKAGMDIIKLLSEKTGFLSSNSAARRSLEENSIYVNKTKVGVAYIIEKKDLINNKYILINKGKKSTFLVKFS